MKTLVCAACLTFALLTIGHAEAPPRPRSTPGVPAAVAGTREGVAAEAALTNEMQDRADFQARFAAFKKRIEALDAGKPSLIADGQTAGQWQYAEYTTSKSYRFWRWVGPGASCHSFESEADFWQKSGMLAGKNADAAQATSVDFLNYVGAQGWELLAIDRANGTLIHTFRRHVQ